METVYHGMKLQASDVIKSFRETEGEMNQAFRLQKRRWYEKVTGSNISGIEGFFVNRSMD